MWAEVNSACLALQGCVRLHGPSLARRMTFVTDELTVATEAVLSRQEVVSQLQRELRNEEQNTHPRER